MVLPLSVPAPEEEVDAEDDEDEDGHDGADDDGHERHLDVLLGRGRRPVLGKRSRVGQQQRAG